MTFVRITMLLLQNPYMVTNNDHLFPLSTNQTQNVEDPNTSLRLTCMQPAGNTESMVQLFWGNIHVKIFRRTSVDR